MLAIGNLETSKTSALSVLLKWKKFHSQTIEMGRHWKNYTIFRIEGSGSKTDGFDNLNSIKGTAPKSHATFLPVIGDVDDFRSARQHAAYLGIVPGVSGSSETSYHGRIAKSGSKTARPFFRSLRRRNP